MGELSLWQFAITAIGFFIAWTSMTVMVVLWLAKEFKNTRHAAYNAAIQTRHEMNQELEKLEARILRLELWSAKKNGIQP